MEYYSATKNNEILPFAMTWVELDCYYAKWSKSEKDKYNMISTHLEFKEQNKVA